MVALAARAGAPATAGGCPSLVGGRRDCPAAHRLAGVVLTRALRARRLLAQSDLAGRLRTAPASGRWPPRCRSQLVRAKAMAVFAARGAVPVLRWNTRVQPTGDRVSAACLAAAIPLLRPVPGVQARASARSRAHETRAPEPA